MYLIIKKAVRLFVVILHLFKIKLNIYRIAVIIQIGVIPDIIERILRVNKMYEIFFGIIDLSRYFPGAV